MRTGELVCPRDHQPGSLRGVGCNDTQVPPSRACESTAPLSVRRIGTRVATSVRVKRDAQKGFLRGRNNTCLRKNAASLLASVSSRPLNEVCEHELVL